MVFGRNRGNVEAVAAVPLGQSELFHAVDEVRIIVTARCRLDDERPVVERNEASAETEQHKTENKALKELHI